MTMLARLLNPAESRSTLRDPDGWLLEALTGGSSTLSGQIISPQNAMGVSAYYAAMRAISEDCGKLPLQLFERLSPRGKRRLFDDPLYRLIHDEPNPEMSSQTFRETLTGHGQGWGGGFAEIEQRRDRPEALWPLDPTTVRVEREGESRMLVYKVRHNPHGSEVSVPARDIFHLHGFGFDGLTGYSVAKIAKQTLGLAMATEKFGAAYFGRAGRPAGRLEFPNPVKPERVPALRQQFDDVLQGEQGWHKTLILEDGATWKPYSYPHDDAQWIESRNFSIEDIARWFRIPPHKIQHLLRATFDNIAEQSIEYVVDALMPWLLRWEHEIWRKLIPRKDQSRLFAEHNVEGLLRGDPEMQSKVFATGRTWGWFSANDVLELMNRNPIGPQGDIYLSPENMAPATTFTIAMPGQEKPSDEAATVEKVLRLLQRDNVAPEDPPLVTDKSGPIVSAHLPQMAKAYVILLTIEAKKAKQASRRSKLAEWTAEFYDRHGEQVRDVLGDRVDAFCGSLWAMYRDGAVPEAVLRTIATYTADLVETHVAKSKADLLEDVSQDVTEVLAEWRTERPTESATAALGRLTDVIHSILGIKDGDGG